MSVSIAAPWRLSIWTSVTEGREVAPAFPRDFVGGALSLALLEALLLGQRLALLLVPP